MVRYDYFAPELVGQGAARDAGNRQHSKQRGETEYPLCDFRELRCSQGNYTTRLAVTLLRMRAVAAARTSKHECHRTSGDLLHRQLLALAYEIHGAEREKFEAALVLNFAKVSENAFQPSQRS
jgi:hypothetical protein